MDEEKKYQRYQRQILLNGFGTETQDKLLSAKVLVIGAGGLGCPALQYLAATGVGHIGIVDHDVVELSNLHRQILYSMEDIGKGKAETAAKKISSLNPTIMVEVFSERISNKNALRVISGYDIVLDGSDNFATRYVVNDACVLLDKPLIYGAVLKYEGQVGVFNLADQKTGIKINYRDLFPVPPSGVLSCNDVGVIGVLPGIIGVMQAAEVIKIIAGKGVPLCSQIATYDALNNSYYIIEISKNKDSESMMPRSEREFLEFNYESFCDMPDRANEVTPEVFAKMRKDGKVVLIDVREKEEMPDMEDADCIRIPLSGFENNMGALPTERKIVLICKTGTRSLKALQILKNNFQWVDAYSLKGGLDAMQKVESSKR